MTGWSGRWNKRSGLAKVDLYTRGTIYLLVWTGVATLVVLFLSAEMWAQAPWVLIVAGLLLGLAEGLLCARLARRAMDAYLGHGPRPGRLFWWTAGVAAAETLVVVATARAGAVAPMTALLAVTALPLSSVHALLVPNRTIVLTQLAVLPVVWGLVSLAPMTAGDRLFAAVFVTFVSAWMAFTARASMWILAVMWELREARDVQARLAVAEERLRFGRDLHDVVGRNLAVVALKSELAVQLARRGRPEAVDQMLAVQEIAQDTQREVREVVRGYREADLRVELEGARSVLTAAGITCTLVADGLDLPQDVQSTLGWVVREAATNVLRHGDARRCTVSVAEVDGAAVLVVENDGAETRSRARGGGERAGTGLAGLRERLTAVGGELVAGPGRDGRFRLTARIPLDRADAVDTVSPVSPVPATDATGPVEAPGGKPSVIPQNPAPLGSTG
ncbi:sensor histidine kinase [Streptomyces yaizuensis]|uniref:Histidine kinase n=1 Tax=Streptomyces yaizuensis TaxID=2989713 RepID=A0ABQ5P202_9ACTN|nr:histidine kinase [Streptomyces sp. YSPA8]GLF96549.1 histidine kinase [Streptomyces sp. YSPA8]